jgi:hypothetical protein
VRQLSGGRDNINHSHTWLADNADRDYNIKEFVTSLALESCAKFLFKAQH